MSQLELLNQWWVFLQLQLLLLYQRLNQYLHGWHNLQMVRPSLSLLTRLLELVRRSRTKSERSAKKTRRPDGDDE